MNAVGRRWRRRDRLRELTERVQLLEDHRDILGVLMTYGPAADSGSDDVMRSVFTDDAEYWTGFETIRGVEAIAEMIARSPTHRAIMAGGSAHMATMPVVLVEGDRATAVCHGQLLRYTAEEDRFRIWRTSAVLLEFRRTPAGWRIHRRRNILLDGSPESHAEFREGLARVGRGPHRP